MPTIASQLPTDWRTALADELTKPYLNDLQAYIDVERSTQTVYPPPEDTFNAFVHTPYEQVKVLLLGQDPYHGAGQAHGLCFSVRPGVKRPPSLVNMHKELNTDLGCPVPKHGCLTAWAERGVMMLNAVLTVRAGKPASHSKHGWETFTDAVIAALSKRPKPVVFALWGGYAQKKEKLIDATRHRVVTAAHPSPLSMKKFLGSKPFSAINTALRGLGEEPIDWCLAGA